MKINDKIAFGTGLIAVIGMAASGAYQLENPTEPPPIDIISLMSSTSLATGAPTIVMQDTMTGGVIEAPRFPSVNIWSDYSS